MDDVAQVTVVGRRGVAEHGVDPGGFGDRKFGTGIEPDGGVGSSTLLAGQVTDDLGGLDGGATGRAGERAGNDHRGMQHGLRRQVFGLRAGQEVGEVTGNGHCFIQPEW